MGRSKLAYWNLIKGFNKVGSAEQPANDYGAIPGTNTKVSNPAKCSPYTHLPMLDFQKNFNSVNLSVYM